MRRRRFIFTAAAPLLAAGGSAWASGNKVPFRLIYGNDTTNVGGCVSPFRKAREPFRPGMLEASVDETAGTGVDAHFLQPGLGVVPMWPSKVIPLEAHYRWLKERYGQDPDSYGRYVLGGGDVVKVFLDRCRLRGMAGFISLRMNDTHHKEFADSPVGQKPKANLAMSVNRQYVEHPEWRIKPGSARGADVVQNWAVPDVRALRLALIGELAANYDLEGLELDFMRFYSLFREGETTSASRATIMTDFVRQVRTLLNANERGGKHIWLCLRVPALLKGLDALGLDLAALATVGADMFNVSSSYYTVQQTDFAVIRERVPDSAVYLELCHTTWTGKKLQDGYDVTPYRRTTREQYQTAAHLAYSRGASGVSLFNFAYYREHGLASGRGPFHEPPFDALPSLRDAAALAEGPQHWFLAPGWNNPFVRPPRLPRELPEGRETSFTLDLAPPRRGWRGDARLRLQFDEPLRDSQIDVILNGSELAATSDISEPFPAPYAQMLGTPETLRAWTVPTPLLRAGANRLLVKCGNTPAESRPLLTFIDLAVS